MQRYDCAHYTDISNFPNPSCRVIDPRKIIIFGRLICTAECSNNSFIQNEVERGELLENTLDRAFRRDEIVKTNKFVKYIRVKIFTGTYVAHPEGEETYTNTQAKRILVASMLVEHQSPERRGET